MSEPEKPKRKFWQFHLSTVVLMMLAVGALVGVNLEDRISPPSNPDGLYLIEQGITGQYGWPLIAMETVDRDCIGRDRRPVVIPPPRWDRAAICTNLIIAINILLLVFLVSERIIRRREARKT